MNTYTKNPGLAAVLSFVFSGLGQLYNGQLKKGLIIIFVSAVNILILIIGSILIGFWLTGKIPSSQLLILGLLLSFSAIVSICILGIYSVTDAYRACSR